ncbi:hypothetical protein M135_3833 [Bacteroides fragilis str. S36L5]|uniref:Uncharacterized protein n=1 Tax=Bacteroides fragilis str. S36L11 TaxID=1339327 RepID=A0A015YXB5_BACFG|nr:hypothetical protein M077_3603 [Bacteroides fragilis str. 2-F-2 \
MHHFSPFILLCREKLWSKSGFGYYFDRNGNLFGRKHLSCT